jgi:hypothetical protein
VKPAQKKGPARSMRESGHRFRAITAGQNTRSVAQYDQPARQLGNPAAVDRASNRQIRLTCDNQDAGINAEGPSTYFISAAFARSVFSKAVTVFRS